jgi:hypothetical protein
MNTPRPVRRNSHFWESCFLLVLEEQLRRVPQGDSLLQGPRWATIARNLADDCERARRAEDGAAKCDACIGVGCEACRWTGLLEPGQGLRAPLASEGSGAPPAGALQPFRCDACGYTWDAARPRIGGQPASTCPSCELPGARELGRDLALVDEDKRSLGID